MIDEYVEIIHLSPELQIVTRKEGGRAEREIVDRILELEKTTKIHYINGRFPNWKIPRRLPLNNPIRIGGQVWEEGVQVRARMLRKAGYTNVNPDRTISISYEDFKTQ